MTKIMGMRQVRLSMYTEVAVRQLGVPSLHSDDAVVMIMIYHRGLIRHGLPPIIVGSSIHGLDSRATRFGGIRLFPRSALPAASRIRICAPSYPCGD